MNALRKVKEYIKQHGMLNQNDRVILGLSGGADSVCLFLMLHAMAKENGWLLYPVHVNHGIRGEEALEDQKFCEKLCEKYGYSCRVISVDVPGLAKFHGISEEEAGRNVRYEAFENLAAQLEEQVGKDSVKIAVAHHKNDQAETVLHHLCRGTDVTGMAGIRSRRGNLIRPLLCLSREEIETYLRKECQPFQTDSTNQTDEYTRNRLRNCILPQLTEKINKKTVEHICELADTMAEVEDFLGVEGKKAWEQLVTFDSEEFRICVEEMEKVHPVMKRWVISKACERLSGTKKNIDKTHIQSVMELAEKQVGRKINLPYGMEAVREYGAILLHIPKENEDGNWEIPLSTDGTSQKLIDGTIVTAKIISAENIENISKEIPKNSCIKWFDYDKIKNTVVLRTLQKDDEMVIDTAGHHKSVKKLCMDAGISARERAYIWGIAEGSNLLWVPRVRAGAGCYVTQDTKRILEIEIKLSTEEGND